MHKFIMKAIVKGLERGPALQDHGLSSFLVLWVFKTYIVVTLNHKIICVAAL